MHERRSFVCEELVNVFEPPRVDLDWDCDWCVGVWRVRGA